MSVIFIWGIDFISVFLIFSRFFILIVLLTGLGVLTLIGRGLGVFTFISVFLIFSRFFILIVLLTGLGVFTFIGRGLGVFTLIGRGLEVFLFAELEVFLFAELGVFTLIGKGLGVLRFTVSFLVYGFRAFFTVLFLKLVGDKVDGQ
jgi:hypothetical protein